MTNHETLEYKIEEMQKNSDTARDGLNRRLDKIDNNVEKISDNMNKFILKVETKFITKAHSDKKYATKLTEKIVYGMVGIALSGFALAITSLIIK